MYLLNLFLEQKYLGSAGGIDGLLEENAILEQELELLQQDTVSNQYQISGDKIISILHLSCRMSDLQFSLVLQTHAHVL